MMINLGYRLSPSESDNEDENVQHDELESPVTCFHCIGEGKQGGLSYHDNGYLRSSYFENLFGHRLDIYGHIQDSITLFGFYWPISQTEEDLEKLFQSMRQVVIFAKSQASQTSGFVFTDLSAERKQVNRCLEFILTLIRNKTVLDTDVILTLLTDCHSLLQDMGRLCEVSVSPVYFHLHLDIYWRLLCIVHFVQINYPDVQYNRPVCDLQSQDGGYSVYDQLLHVILWDLMTFGLQKSPSVSKGGEYRKVTLYPCMCVQELWLLCIKLSQLRTSKLNGDSFWLSLHHIIKTISDWKLRSKDMLLESEDCCVITNPPDVFDIEDSTSVCLWILSNVTTLYQDNHEDSKQEKVKYVSNYHDLQSLLNKFLNSTNVSDDSLKQHLHCCLHITSRWEPSTRLLIELWEYFYRRLNDTFHDKCSKVAGLACVDRTIAGLYSRCKSWSSGYSEQVKEETSYHLFLRLVSQHLTNLYKGSQTREWKQFKGRIYSKFYPKRIQDLTEVGLHNLTCLFLTLALTSHLEDVASKLCDFYDMLGFEHFTYGKRSVIWRGAFTLMLIHKERDTDLTFLADRMSESLEHCVSEFKESDTSTKHKLWELIQIYMEGTQEIVDLSGNLTMSEYKLIGPGIDMLLPVCSAGRLRHMLSVLQSVLNKFRRVIEKRDTDHNISLITEEQHRAFSDRLWKHLYRFIVDHAQTLTPPQEVAEIAAEFCLLALKYSPPSPSKDTFLTIFQNFAGGEKIEANVSCSFLSHLLGSYEILRRLETDLTNWESFIIRCWFQCCVLVPPTSDLLQDLTRSVVKLKEVSEIFQQANLELPSNQHDITVSFLKAVHKVHGKQESWQEKMQFQQRITPYFTDIHKYLLPVLQNNGPSDVLSNMYLVIGNMMKYCAKLIYIKQDVVVPSILSSMILPPQVMDKDKPVIPALLSVIRDNLHLFIQGLGKLAYERDSFVQRRLRDVVLTYLPKFTIQTSSNPCTVTAVHPIVACLTGSYIQQPSEEAIKFRHYMLQAVIDNFLVVKNMTAHPQHSMGWSYLNEVIQRTTSPIVMARDFKEVLLLCLEYILILPEQSAVSSRILSVLQHTAQAHSSNTDVLPISKLSEDCQKFIKGYCRFSMGGVLNVIERLAMLHKLVVISVIKDMTFSITEIERKRGIGQDNALRKKYYQVLQTLGEEGQQEISLLKSGF